MIPNSKNTNEIVNMKRFFILYNLYILGIIKLCWTCDTELFSREIDDFLFYISLYLKDHGEGVS